jgi:hypothetical protein
LLLPFFSFFRRAYLNYSLFYAFYAFLWIFMNFYATAFSSQNFSAESKKIRFNQIREPNANFLNIF